MNTVKLVAFVAVALAGIYSPLMGAAVAIKNNLITKSILLTITQIDGKKTQVLVGRKNFNDNATLLTELPCPGIASIVIDRAF
jgi:hypothetical protein